MVQFLLVVWFITYILTLGGCVVKPQPITEAEIRQRIQRDLGEYTKGQEPVTGPIDLYSAMARALKYYSGPRF